LAYGRQVHEYRKNAVNGASPLQLIIMLYDGSLRFLEGGKRAMESGDREKQNENLQRAQKIVMELMSCLDMEQGGEISKNLLGIYSYVLNELVMANLRDEVEPIERCMKILRDLRESWCELEKKLKAPEQAEVTALAA
jgi:flagellar secretion chaperone FliS